MSTLITLTVSRGILLSLLFSCDILRIALCDLGQSQVPPKLSLRESSVRNKTHKILTSFNGTENEFVVRNWTDFVMSVICESGSGDPIEWLYTGAGSPNLVREEYHVPSEAMSQTSSEIYFRHEENYMKRLPFHTGLYTCRNVGNHLLNSSVYLFFPRKDGQILLNNDGKQIHVIKRPAGSIEGGITFPCLSTDPAVNVSLFKRNDKILDKKTYEKVKNAVYFPKVGFNLEYTTGAEVNVNGEYKCSTGLKKDYMIYSVVEEKVIKVSPNQTLLFTSTKLNLTCEAAEPVLIHLVAFGQIQPDYYDDREREDVDETVDDMESDDIIESETTEHTEVEAHVANYIDLSPAVGDVGEFQCLSETDGQVLHSWVYQIISKEADAIPIGIKYNETSRSFTCQTKTSTRGKLSFVMCDSPSECQINRQCLEKFDNCRGYKRLPGAYCDWDKDCREIFHHSGTGFIRCLDDGVDEILGFADLPGRVYFGNNLTSIKAEDAAGLTTEPEKVAFGTVTRVSLRKWNFLFSRTHRWAYLFQNGTYLPNSKYDNFNSGKFEMYPELKAIECSLMLRDGLSWYNVSLPIRAEVTADAVSTTTLLLVLTEKPAQDEEAATSTARNETNSGRLTN